MFSGSQQFEGQKYGDWGRKRHRNILCYYVYSLARTRTSSVFFAAPASAPIPDTKEGVHPRSRPRRQRTPMGDGGPNAVALRFNPRRRAGVATLPLSIFNCLLRMILHIQSSFRSPLIMDHAHLSCIVNVGTELEARYFIPPPLLTAVINTKACAPERREQNKVKALLPPWEPTSKIFVSIIWVFFFCSRIAFVGLPTAHPAHHHPPHSTSSEKSPWNAANAISYAARFPL